LKTFNEMHLLTEDTLVIWYKLLYLYCTSSMTVTVSMSAENAEGANPGCLVENGAKVRGCVWNGYRLARHNNINTYMSI